MPLSTLEEKQAPVLSPVKNYQVLAASKKYSSDKIVRLDIKTILRPKELDVCPPKEDDQIEEFKAKYNELDKGQVFWVEGMGYVLVDGWSRADVAEELLIVTDEFHNKGKGTLEDALKLRMQANCKHGKRWKREQWVKLSWNTHELMLKKNKHQTLVATAKFLGINENTFQAYFRYRDGMNHTPVDHPYGGRKGDHGRKREVFSGHNQLVTNSCHLMSTAASLLERLPIKHLDQDLKDRLAKQLSKMKRFWELL